MGIREMLVPTGRMWYTCRSPVRQRFLCWGIYEGEIGEYAFEWKMPEGGVDRAGI